MGKGVTLSKKHGLNPSMAVCPICGKAESVALLGHIKGDEEAPRYIYKEIFVTNVKLELLIISVSLYLLVKINVLNAILLLVKIYLHKRLKVVLFL